MRSILATAAVLSFSLTAFADWPQFQGPDRNGISPDKTPLAKSWPEGGPKVLWTLNVGPGYGSAAIVGNEVFILDHKNEKDVVRCIGLETGKEIWSFEYDAPGKIDHAGSRSTPAVDDKFVYTVGPFGDFYCFDRSTHKPVWNKNLFTEFDAKKPSWASAQSPLLYKDLIVVVPAGKKAGIVAYKKDGEMAWKSEACGSEQYMSAMPMKIDGVDQIVGYGNGGKGSTVFISVDPATGKTLWKFDKWGCSIPIASPTHVGDGKVFITGGYDAGSVMIQVSRKDDQWSVNELWRLKAKECGSQIHDALFWKGNLYVDNNENGRSDGLTCLSLDGKVAWTSKTANSCRGGQIIADGMIYKVDGNKGDLYLIEPSAAELKVVAKAKLLDPGEIWAPLSISGSKLIIRDQKQMKCLDVGK